MGGCDQPVVHALGDRPPLTSLGIAIISLIAAYYAQLRDCHPLWFAAAMAIFGVSADKVWRGFPFAGANYWRPVLAASTCFRNKKIRVSASYLISIHSGDRYLLVRGNRIPTQFQPVGGVFKATQDTWTKELQQRLGAELDDRFLPDTDSERDLRLRIPGRNLHRFIRWFNRREGRELFPFREFYEELIVTGILKAKTFPYFDCEFVRTCHTGLTFDPHSQLTQIIIAEIYELRPSRDQAREIDQLCANPPEGVAFALASELRQRHFSQGPSADIASTAAWLCEGATPGGDPDRH